MTWTNAFDVGACTVKVSRAGVDLYSGVLAKSATSDTFAGDFGETLFVAVSADGAVSLESDDVTSWDAYALRVIPSYDIGTSDLRLSGISWGGGGGYVIQADAVANVVDGSLVGPQPSIRQDDGIGSADPDPFVLRPFDPIYGDYTDGYTELSLLTQGGG